MKNKLHIQYIGTITILFIANFAFAQTNIGELTSRSDSIYNIGVDLYNAGKYNEAITMFNESYGIDTIIYPDKHVKREHSKRWAARCNYMMGDTATAFSISPTCVAQQPDRRLTEKSDSLIMLCRHYISQGKYTEALSTIEKAQQTMKKSIGTKNFLYANLLENKMQIYMGIKEYDKFIDCLGEIAETRKVSLGETNPQYIAVIDNTALAYDIFKKDYIKAAEYYALAAELYEKSPYQDIIKYLKTVINLGDAYKITNQTKKAIETLEKAYKIIKENGLENHKYHTITTNLLAHSYYDSGDYKKSLEIYLDNAEHEKIINGEKSIPYARSLNNIGSLYSEIHEYTKAIEALTKGLEIIKEIAKEDDLNIISLEQGLGNAYYGLGKLDNSIEHYQRAIMVCRMNDMENSLKYADIIENMANAYKNKSELETANKYYHEAQTIYDNNMTENDIVEYSQILNNYATNFIDLGRYEDAMRLLERSLSIRKKYIGENTIPYASTLTNIANVYLYINDFETALKLFQQSAEIKKSTYGEYDYKYAEALNNIASVYNYMNDNANSHKYLRHSLKIFEKLISDGTITESVGYANILNNIGNYYSHISNHDKASEYYYRSAETSKRLLGEKSIEYVRSLGNLASTYLKKKDFTNALKFSAKVSESWKYIYNTEEHPDYANSLVQLGNIYSSMEKNDSALSYYQKALDIYAKVIGTDHFEYGKTLMNIGTFFENTAQYTKALEYENKGKNILKEKLGSFHPMYIKSLEDISDLYFGIDSMKPALENLKEAMQASRHNLISNFSFMTATERETYWNKNNEAYRNIIKLAGLMGSDTSAVRSAYDAELITKGLLLASEINFTNIIMESDDSLLIGEYERMKKMHYLLNKDLEKPINERIYNSDSLAKEIQKIERQLVERINDYGNMAQTVTITWRDVQKSLSPNDVAIEFTSYTTNDTLEYAAIVLTKEMESPILVNLTDQYTLSDITNGVSKRKNNENDSERGATTLSSKKFSVYESTDIYELLWKPLEKYFPENPRIFFAPSGILHKIGIEYATTEHGNNISDKYEIYRISSSRDLAMEHNTNPLKSCTLYGGIRYDSDTTAMKQESDRYVTRGTSSSTYTSFAEINKDEVRNSLPYLPGTKDEIDNIKQILKKNKIKTDIHEGITANEESIKQLSGDSKSILHIATHGFFLTSNERLSGDNALVLSGLLLSGANHAWQNNPIPEGVEDGILTAKEISFLDLRKTDLVVLSACQTALGEITGEGVFGLQRGFKKAGVKSIIMSLWSVDDQATQIMMVEFYKNLTKGMSKRDAFISAQNKLKATSGFENPRFWAAFILLDGYDK